MFFKKLVLIFITLILISCGEQNEANGNKFSKIPAGAKVLALGDSLTEGYGTTRENSYPSQLALITNWQVINGGISGDTSAQALARVPKLLQEHNPQLVIISIGGNDFLQKIPSEITEQNIEKIITEIQKTGAEIVLVGIPAYCISCAAVANLKDEPMFSQIAKRERIALLAGSWSRILSKSSLKSDQIHANAQGYKMFAEDLAKFLKKLGAL